MIPFILIPLSIGMGLIGLGAFFWALEHGQFNDPEGAASRILFTDACIEPNPHRKGHRHGQLVADAHHGDAD
ncbi:cbb3-type cytochrome oxidase assembly protein CcoS [Neoroseomonas soli]